MRNAKVFLAVFCILAGNAPFSRADEFDEARPLGVPDVKLCGFDVNRTPLSAIMTTLGQPSSQSAAPEEPRHVTYTWIKGPLRINVSTYTVNGYQAKAPALIQAEGADPSKFCATGRGIVLGDPIDNALKLYGKNHDTFPFLGDDAYNFKWQPTVDVLLSLAKDGRVKRITLTGKLQ